MKFIDDLLNKITMYRLLVYGLGGLVAISGVFAALGRLTFEPHDMVLSLGILLVSAFVTEYVLSKIWNRPMNTESWIITSLILYFILEPPTSLMSGVVLFAAGMIASASKFLITWHGKHLFNPAAFAAAILGLTAVWPASWWVGSTALWWLTLPLGLAVVRKIRRMEMVAVFAGAAITVHIIQFTVSGQPLVSGLSHALVASPLIFLATIMLTEPATMPARRHQQLIFAGGAGILYAWGLSIGPIHLYPEVVLLLANIYAFIVSPKVSTMMRLKAIRPVSPSVTNFVFEPEKPLSFRPGQYMEWTMPNVPFDARGNRRMFTIASSPTEKDVHLGIKFYEPSSMYKYRLRQLQPGDVVYASQLAGSFTLPKDTSKKLVFIAGGIGITPFRSMVQYMLDAGKIYDLTLIYLVSDEQELAYMDIFNEAKKQGITVYPVVTNSTNDPSHDVLYMRLDAQQVKRLVPDYTARLFYISGPNAMVDTIRGYLKEIGVPRSRIKTDHFSGY